MKVGIMLGVAAGTIATYAIMSENKKIGRAHV